MNPVEAVQYQALTEGVAWWNLSSRGKLFLTGPDHVSFLHAVTSNDVRGLAVGSGRYGLLLSATGKILADFCYYRFPGFLLVDVMGEGEPGLKDRLEGSIIMDDVRVEDISSGVAHFAVAGPQAPAWLKNYFGTDPPVADFGVLRLGSAADPEPLRLPWVVRRNRESEWGFEILAPAAMNDQLRSALAGLGPELTDGVRQVSLLERGVPSFGREFTGRNNPVEAGLYHGVSLDKGCYPGQEVVSRAIFVGGVARLLCRIQVGGTVVPAPGAPVWDGGREIGWVASAAWSPRRKALLGFAWLKRSAVDQGKVIEVEVEGGSRTGGVVMDVPSPSVEGSGGDSTA